MSKIAVDTNILISLYNATDIKKRRIAENLVLLQPVVSAQVISEYINVTKRLLKLPKIEILQKAILLFAICKIVDTNMATLQKAEVLIIRYDFQLFDAIVVAAALQAGCIILYSEDMQHGQFIENKMRIVNPFI